MTASSKRNDYVHLVAEGQGMDVNVYAFIKRRGILRILIINEYVKKRGAEQIVADQKKLFSQYNNNVQCLCFDIGYANNVPEGYDISYFAY